LKIITGRNQNFKSTMSIEKILVFDNTDDYSNLLDIVDYDKIKIITTNYETYELLEKNNISSINSDKFLTDFERLFVQNTCYNLSDWYENLEIKNHLIYKNVNLGSLIKSELINVLVNFLKLFYELYKISINYKNQNFVCSEFIGKIMKNFTNNISIFSSNTKNINFLPLDSLDVNYTLRYKNYTYPIKIPKNLFLKLKFFSEKVSNSMITNNNYIKNQNPILFSEFDTLGYEQFLKKNDLPFVIYNRRKPAIWNKKTLDCIKNSTGIVENEVSLSSSNIKKSLKTNFSKIESQLNELFLNDDIFSKIFQIDNISFWNIIKSQFIEFFKKRVNENLFEIELSIKLFEKYNFGGLMINNEVGPNEQILSQLAKIKKIPIFLYQHGLIFDTKKGYEMNIHHGALAKLSDFSLVWGKTDRQYRETLGFKTDKIIDIGSCRYDNFENIPSFFKEKNYVVLATSGPTKEKVFDLTVDTIKKNSDTIKNVCKIITSLNLDLVIKIHPDPSEFDPSIIAHEINPNIKIIKDGNFSSIIKNSSFVIVIDFSTVILDCYLLNKPVISLPVKDNGYGLPTALTNNSCICTEISNLEKIIKNLSDNNFRTELIKNSNISLDNYLSYRDNSSDKLIEFLKNYSKKI
tara:strand:+ start:33955 stop:35856 length:1902 start_codon:yes stop_codon:yes gene_type:complete